MSEPTTEKCPNCEAGLFEKYVSGREFKCFTLILNDGTVMDGNHCLRTQRDQLATSITDLQQQLLQRAHVIANDTESIRQLEHVCRLMAKTLRNYPEHAWIVEEFEKVVGE